MQTSTAGVMVRCQVSCILLLSVLAPAALAAQSNAAADNRYRAAMNDLNNAQQNLNNLQQRQRDLPGEIDKLSKRIDDNKKTLADGQKKLDDAKQKVGDAGKVVDQRKAEVKSAQDAVRTAQDTADAIHDKAMAEMQKRPGYVEAAAAKDAAQKKLDDATNTRLAANAKNAAYMAQSKAAADAEANVKQLRVNPTGGPEVAEASQTWLDSRNKLKEMEKDALDADPVVTAARKLLVDKTGAVKSMRDLFDAEIAKQSDMQAAMGVVADVRIKLDKAKEEQKKAELARADAQKQADKTKKSIDDAQSSQKQAQTDLSAKQQEQSHIKSDINQAENRVQAAQREVNAARR